MLSRLLQGFQLRPSTYPLRPIIPNNVSTTCITAAAGTELASAYSSSTVIIFLDKRALQRLCCPFLTHEPSMGQTFVHCPKFPTAVLRRSLDLFPVPMWLLTLPCQLKIISLVSHYLTNSLILRLHISRR